MIFNKSLRTSALVSFIVIPLLLANPTANPGETSDPNESGRQKLIAAVSNRQIRSTQFNNKQVDYAQALNLAPDLNIEQIVEFCGCKTLLGKHYLTQTLSSPVSPKDQSAILANRQNCIKMLVKNPALKQEVEQHLNEAHEQEQEIVELLSEFFIGRTCPELKQLELVKQQNPFIYPVAKFLQTHPAGKFYSTTMNVVGLAGSSAGTALLAKLLYNNIKNDKGCSHLVVPTAYLSLVVGVSGYTFYKDYSLNAQKRVKMHALNKLIAIAEKTERLCLTNNMQKQFKLSDIRDTEGAKLIKTLKHARYRSKDTVVFNIPAVHSFLYTLYEKHDRLSKLFASIAELDAYNALATKIIESQQQKNKLCFVSFLNEEKPALQGANFWNVLVSNAVPSSLSEDRHIILTGPNAGGKTTSIRALLQNIVLGQTFGIAAADSFAFTPFDMIESYLNISDDLINGLSLFASEVKRAQGILHKIKSLEPNKKYFFALDELFTGTRAEEGEKCAYEFIKKINEFDGVQFVYATHFGKLTELSQETLRCTNYKVDAPTKDANNKLVYPYTVSQGINQTNVALDIAKEANLFE